MPTSPTSPTSPPAIAPIPPAPEAPGAPVPEQEAGTTRIGNVAPRTAEAYLLDPDDERPAAADLARRLSAFQEALDQFARQVADAAATGGLRTPTPPHASPEFRPLGPGEIGDGGVPLTRAARSVIRLANARGALDRALAELLAPACDYLDPARADAPPEAACTGG